MAFACWDYGSTPYEERQLVKLSCDGNTLAFGGATVSIIGEVVVINLLGSQYRFL